MVAGDGHPLGGELLQDAGDERLAPQRRRHAVVGPVAKAHQIDAEGLLRVLAGLGDVVADRFQFSVQTTESRGGAAKMAIALLLEQPDAISLRRDRAAWKLHVPRFATNDLGGVGRLRPSS